MSDLPIATRRRRPRSTGEGAPTNRELEMMIHNCEDDIDRVGGEVSSAMIEFRKIKDRLNIWGSLIVGAMVAGGLISDQAGAILKAVFGTP